MVADGETLKQFGVNPQAESIRLSRLTPEERKRVLIQNLEAYTNEVLDDKPVSILYHYWKDHDGNVYTDPSLKPIFNLQLQFDPRERGDLIRYGVYCAIDLTTAHPNHAVCLYSPPGDASFDNNNNNPFTHITYTYGQLYLMYFDGQRINAVAIKTTNTGEEWVKTIMPALYSDAQNTKSEQEKISLLIQTPVYFENIDSFIKKNYWGNFMIYDGKAKKYYLDEILDEIRNTFAGVIEPTINNYNSSMVSLEDFEITERLILNSYLALIHNHLRKNGINQMQLSGSCGGRTTFLDDIEEALGINHDQFTNPLEKLVSLFSSTYRVLTQTDHKHEWHEGTCVRCQKKTRVGGCNICAKCEQELT